MAAEVPLAAQAAAAAPPPVPVFALHPAALMGNLAFIDYNTKEGNKAYERAIEPLDPVYDGRTKGLQMFIHQIKRQATICGWTHSILTIPVGNEQLPLLTKYGQITMQHIADHAATYMAIDGRAQQDAQNFKLFLDGSLDKDLMMRVLAQSDKYTINGQEHGPSMFRVILKIVGIETKATIAVINATLRALPAKLVELKNDVVMFNEYVTEQCSELTSRGQEPNDLLYLLFEAYLTSTNKIFVEYIRTKEAAVFDNSILDLEPTDLMVIAEDKYKIMLLRGEWRASTTTASTTTSTDEHIVALQAAVLALSEKKTKRVDTKGKGKTASPNTGQWAWKDVAPKEGEPLTKTVGTKQYVHCPNHASTQWVLADKHKDGCTSDPTWKFPVPNGKKAPDGDTKQLQYTKAMMGIVKHDDGSDDEDEVI